MDGPRMPVYTINSPMSLRLWFNYSTVQGFFHQPAHPRGEGATIKRISPPRKPQLGGGGGLRRIRGVSAVGFTDKNRPSELTCIQIFLVSAAGPRGGIK